MDGKVSIEYILEMLVLGRLSKELKAEVEERLTVDSEYQEKLGEIEQSDREFFAKYPSNEVIPEIMNRYNKIRSEEMPVHIERKPIFFKRLLIASPAFAFVIILLFFILPRERTDIQYPFLDTQSDVTRIKGIHDVDLSKTQLLIHRKTNESVELLKNGDRGHSGDLLQLGYVAGQELYGVILSIDGRGNVTLHFPDNEKQTPILNQEGSFYFPNAIELDDAPDFERFFFLTSKYKFNVKDIMFRAKILAENLDRARKEDIASPKHIKQSSILILKGEKK